MAVDFEQFQKSPAAEQTFMVADAQRRLDTSLLQGPSRIADVRRFFRDVYLLDQAAPFNFRNTKLRQVREFAASPRIRGEFVKTLRDQDTAGESKEVLASIHVGEAFQYDRDPRFKEGFDQLATDHKKLIEDAERVRKEAEAEAERLRQEQAEARRRARMPWPPRESNASKSPEWIQAQERIAQLWEQRKQTLPQGLDRETEEADIAYVSAGFDLLKNEIINRPSTRPSKNAIADRAMLEYLIPEMWRQPRMVEAFFKQLERAESGRPAPTNLSQVSTISKILFLSPDLQNLTTPPLPDQAKQVRKVMRAYQNAVHPDVGNHPDISKNLEPHVDTIRNAIPRLWPAVRPLVP